MTRRARKPDESQNPLALPCDPKNEASLRAAFSHTRLREQGYSYERAVAIPALRICLSNVAREIITARNPTS